MADGGLSAALIATAVATAVSVGISLLVKPPQLKDAGESVERKGNNVSKVVAFGVCRVPAVRVYSNVHNNNTRWLSSIYSLGWGPIKQIDQLYVDEQPVFNGTGLGAQYPVAKPEFDVFFDNPVVTINESVGGGQTITKKGRLHFKDFPNLRVGLRRGNPTELGPYPDLLNESDGLLTTDHRGDRTAQIQIRAYRQKDMEGTRFQHSKHGFEALVHGNKVIDPRFDPSMSGKNDLSKRIWEQGSTVSYRNPACVMLTYLLDPMFGLDLPIDSIDTQSFHLLANYCDANGITFDGYISSDANFGEVITKIATSFRGMAYLEQGKVKVRPYEAGISSIHLTDDHIIGNITLSNSNDSKYCNAVKVDFVDQDQQFNTVSYVLPENKYTDAQIQSDGYVREKTLDYPYTTSRDLIELFANRDLKEGKLSRRTLSLTVNNLQVKLKIGDLFTVENELYGLTSANKFRVEQIESTLDNKVLETKIKAVEYQADVYDDSIKADGVFGSNLPVGSLLVPTPTNLRFDVGNTVATGSGVLSWDSEFGDECRHVVQYKVSGSATYETYGEYPSTSCTIANLKTGVQYDFRVKTVGVVNSSMFAELSGVQINKMPKLPAVKNLTAAFIGSTCRLVWSPIDEEITNPTVVSDGFDNVAQLVKHYKVTIANRVYTTTEPWFDFTFELNEAHGALSRDVSATVIAVNIYGEEGATASASASNPAPAAPVNVRARYLLRNLTVEWDECLDLDFAETEVYLMPSNSAVGISPAYLIGTSKTGILSLVTPEASSKGYVFVRHVDVFGAGPSTAGGYVSPTSIDDHFTEWEWTWPADIEAEISAAERDILANATNITKVTNELGTTNAKLTSTTTLAESTSGNLAVLENKVATEYATNTSVSQAASAAQSAAISEADRALSQYKIDATAQFDAKGAAASVKTDAFAYADGKVGALVTLTAGAGDSLAGMQLGTNGTRSYIRMAADKFQIASNIEGTAGTVPFEISGGTVKIKDALIGNLDASKITSGTISADRIAAWSLDANKIATNTTLTVGSGNSIAYMSGTGNIRIAAGNSDMSQAPFQVMHDGMVYATNMRITGGSLNINNNFLVSDTGVVTAKSGTFTGTVNASSGTFSNVTINENCNVKGTIYADKISGDVCKVLSTNTFAYDSTLLSFPAYGRARTIIINPFIMNWSVASSSVVRGFCAIFVNGTEIARTEIFPVGSVTAGTKSGVTFCIGGSFDLPANTVGNVSIKYVGTGGTVSNQSGSSLASTFSGMCFIQ